MQFGKMGARGGFGSLGVLGGASKPAPSAGLAINFLPANNTTVPVVNAGSHAALQWERTQAWNLNCQIQVSAPPVSGGAAVIFTTSNQGPTGGSFAGYEAFLNNAGKIQVRITNSIGSNGIDVTGSTVVTDGVSHNIAVSYDGSSTAAGVKIYVAGVLETPTVNANNLSASIINSQPLVVGNQLGFPYSLGGKLSNFMLSNIARSQAFNAAYTTAAGAIDANTVLAYNFLENTGGTTADLSSNAFNATVSGAIWASGALGNAPGIIQSVLSPDYGGTTRTTSVVTLPNAVTSGSALIYTALVAGAGTITVSDNKGNTWPSATINNTGLAGVVFAVFVLPNVTNGPTVITATGPSGTFWRSLCAEVAGIATVSPLDGATSQYQSAPGTGANAVSSGSITTTANGDFIYGVGSFSSTLQPGTNFTFMGVNATDGINSEQLFQTTAGAIAATFTQASASQATTAVIALKHS